MKEMMRGNSVDIKANGLTNQVQKGYPETEEKIMPDGGNTEGPQGSSKGNLGPTEAISTSEGQRAVERGASVSTLERRTGVAEKNNTSLNQEDPRAKFVKDASAALGEIRTIEFKAKLAGIVSAPQDISNETIREFAKDYGKVRKQYSA